MGRSSRIASQNTDLKSRQGPKRGGLIGVALGSGSAVVRHGREVRKSYAGRMPDRLKLAKQTKGRSLSG